MQRGHGIDVLVLLAIKDLRSGVIQARGAVLVETLKLLAGLEPQVRGAHDVPGKEEAAGVAQQEGRALFVRPCWCGAAAYSQVCSLREEFRGDELPSSNEGLQTPEWEQCRGNGEEETHGKFLTLSLAACSRVSEACLTFPSFALQWAAFLYASLGIQRNGGGKRWWENTARTGAHCSCAHSRHSQCAILHAAALKEPRSCLEVGLCKRP